MVSHLLDILPIISGESLESQGSTVIIRQITDLYPSNVVCWLVDDRSIHARAVHVLRCGSAAGGWRLKSLPNVGFGSSPVRFPHPLGFSSGIGAIYAIVIRRYLRI